MPPSKLRMKNTPEDIDKILKTERKQRRRRRREEAKTREAREESLTPPRASGSGAGKLFSQEELDFDESALPPEQARKPERTDESLYESMKWAAMEDEGIGFYENLLYSRTPAYASSYGHAAGVAMGGVGVKSGVDAMSEEEYTEHVRAGMWYRKNKEEAERQEVIDRERKIKEEVERIRMDSIRREEARRIRKLEELASKRTEAEYRDARACYEERWKKLATSKPAPPPPNPSALDDETPTPALSAFPLRFTDFPWPLYPPVPFPPLSWPSPADVTSGALASFLLSHLEPPARKSTLRTAVLAYHPDRFDRLVGRIPEDQSELRERVRELGLRVSQELNDLLKTAS